MMFKKIKPTKTTLNVNKSYEGETLEQKIFRMMNNKEPISDAAELIYTDREEGVLPDYNIRTDRMEEALGAMTQAAKGHIAKREARAAKKRETETKDSAETRTTEVQGGETPNSSTNK